MFGKLRDLWDETVNLCVIVRNAKDAYLLTKILEVEVERYKMECENFKEPFDSLIRIDLAYNRYEVLMTSLWTHGYNLEPYKNLTMIDEMVKIEEF